MTGQYAYVAPSATDLRGPCPGLNALANHNYLPHNGYATIAQFINATNTVFGMGTDLAAFLSVYAAAIDGDGTGWSMGGTPPSGGLLNLATIGDGLSGSHNKYESDVSPTRGDLYQPSSNADDYSLVMSQFQALFSTQPNPATANYDLGVLTDFRAQRFAQSIAQNPYFFNAPFSGVLVQPAAYTFIYRFFANHSAASPAGVLNQDVLKSFFGVTGTSGSFVYTPGTEQIPANWYRRSTTDEYTIQFFNLDLLAAAETYPQFLDIGGNTGTVNSFAGVDVANLTNGVYNLQTLTQGNNLQCFAFQAAQQALPDAVKSIGGSVTSASSLLSNTLAPVLAALGCPQLQAIDNAQFQQFPGYTRGPELY